MSEQKNKMRKADEKSMGDETETKFSKGTVIKTIIEVAAVAIIIIGGFSSGCIRCTNCGADDNRLIIYASGTTEDGYKYKSCVGPAGCLGFGLNSKCWPTECINVKYSDIEGTQTSGCVTYYNTMGCIAKADVKSQGKYTTSLNCLGIQCVGNEYVENTAETTKAVRRTTCLGMGCGESETIEPSYYNEKMPRQFVKGCWSSK